jgi:hypothetical protein
LSQGGWIGVDFDGTLAFYDKWRGIEHVGEPIPAMVDRVKLWLSEGRQVKIFTARVSGATGDDLMQIVKPIVAFCQENFGRALDITCVKDFGMIELWDDRCVQVRANTGEPVGFSTRGLTLDP